MGEESLHFTEEEMKNHIPMNKWGKDHWSTFAYLETLAVDGGKDGWAIPERARMRTNEKTHPAIGHMKNREMTGYPMPTGGSEYPTRLKDGEVKGHDDWDCIDDMVREKLLKDVGTGLSRAFTFTKLGIKAAAGLRKHKMEGKNFREFVFEEVRE